MVWSNIALIDTNETWQYSPFFSEKIVRLRHITNSNLYTRGLVAQSFNTNEELELYNVKRIYSFNGNDILLCEPILLLNQRLAIKGETQYKPNIFWKIYVDVWQETPPVNPNANRANN